MYFDYTSNNPELYKISLIKTLTYRAYRYSSTWTQFDAEMRRITQDLVNNNFPQTIIEKTINLLVVKLRKKFMNSDSDDDNTTANIPLYFRTFDLSSFKKDRKVLGDIVKKHVTTNSTVKLSIRNYYRPTKLSSCFSLRPHNNSINADHVVYQYDCPEQSCQACYVGYTTNKLLTRAKQHKYAPSHIFKHSIDTHNKPPKNMDNFLDNFRILYRNNNKLVLLSQ